MQQRRAVPVPSAPPPGRSPWSAGEARAALAAAPVIALDRLCAPGPVAVVAPHPDDESLGCGGLIAQATLAGRTVLIVVLTDGAGSHPNSRSHPPATLRATRRREARAAAAALGAREPMFLDAVDGALQAEAPRVGADLRAAIAARGARTIVAPWRTDPHPDHQAAHDLAAAAAADTGARLVLYPVWGLTLPDDADAGRRLQTAALDIASVLPRKRAAILAHRSQTTDLIADDPRGFRLRDEDLARHLGPREAYFLPA